LLSRTADFASPPPLNSHKNPLLQRTRIFFDIRPKNLTVISLLFIIKTASAEENLQPARPTRGKDDKMKYTIEGRADAGGDLRAGSGEQMMTERGSMSWMSPNMKMETTTGGGLGKALGRMFAGEAMFQNRYTAGAAGA
jgi:hypothetical protein